MGDARPERAAVALVVGVDGSSDALEELLAALPTGEGFVVVSARPTERAPASSSLRVVEVGDEGAALTPDTVLVSRGALEVRDGRVERAREHTPGALDRFLRSLAREVGARSAAVLLAGPSAEGSAAAREIEVAGGIAIAAPIGADGAIEASAIDLVLPIAEIPAALVRFARAAKVPPPDDTADETRTLREEHIDRLASVLVAQDLDLRVYKRGTVERRVLRRMALAGIGDPDAYLEHVHANPSEQRALVSDLFIAVTDFFRDPEAFEALAGAAIAPLVDAASPGATLRAWVPACASGEEAYSIAILFLEAIERSAKPLSLQVFATDIDPRALARGRVGIYPASIHCRVSKERLERFFEPLEPRGYCVRPGLRDVVSFAVHDLTKDPPFSRMDLVSCRNVLIYLRPHAQDHVLRLLHVALRSGAPLFLGGSESTGPMRDLYATLSKPSRIYAKIGSSRPLSLPRTRYTTTREGVSTLRSTDPRARRPSPPMGELVRRAVMHARVPPTIVVDGSGGVLFMHGELRPYLRFPDGEPRLELASLLAPDLAIRVRPALYKARRDRETVVAFCTSESDLTAVTKITATPAPELADDAVIVTFEQAGPPDPEPRQLSESPAQDVIIEQLERELLATREDLRHTVEELESANEELLSANEEATSINEELQSANEELEATSEELRSLNEELTTVNAQLREKVEQVERAHDDLSNFFASSKVATVFLDEELRIARFTPSAAELVGLERDHEARLASDVARELLQHDLPNEARQVLADLTVRAREIETRDGRWIARRVLPYRTSSRRIEGIVVTFVDVTELRQATEQLRVRERQHAVIARLGIRGLEEPDLDTFLEQAVRDIQQTLATDFCKILELQPGREAFLVRAGVGWRPGVVGTAMVSADLGSQPGYTLKAGEPVIVCDLQSERRFSGPELLTEHGVTSGLSCVIGGAAEPYGVIAVHTRERRELTREDAYFLQSAASVIAGAVGRHQTRVRLAFESAAALALAETASLSGAIERLHEAITHELGPGIVELWEHDPREDRLVRTALFTSGALDREHVREAFGPSSFGAEQALAGHVLAGRRAEPFSIFGHSHFWRAEAARSLGLRSGFVFPIVSGREALGVVIHVSLGHVLCDEALLRSLESIGRAMGDFARRGDVERRYRTTVDGAPVGIADRSLEGRWLSVNDAVCAITGRRREELLGHPFTEIAHPEDVARESELMTALQEGHIHRYQIEKRYLRTDGSSVWVSVGAALVTKESGEPDYVVVIVEDISARKRAEEDLYRSRARFREVLLRSPVPMMLYDERGRTVDLNGAWTDVTGYAIDEVTTVDAWMEAAFAGGSEEARALFSGPRVDDPRSPPRAIEIVARSGERKTLLFQAATVSFAEAEQLRVVTAADVTELRRFERELVEASRQKDEFIAMLGHELRNPLAAVRSAAELMRHLHPEDAVLSRVQAVLERQSAHMARLLDGLLDISRIIRGKIELHREPIDLVELVGEVLDDLAGRFERSELALTRELGNDALWVDADPVRTTQIVDNLVTNALKYTPAGGAVRVELRREGRRALLRIRDTGQGIEPELLPHIFDTFQQGRQTLDRAQGGLGIGLSLVKLLTELHGGSVSASSEGRGKGAELVVRFPLTTKRPAHRSAERAARGAQRILIIEDNEDVAEMLRGALTVRGHDVSVALRGAEGIERALSSEPDFVLCDLGLPDGVTGFDVAIALRADARTRAVRLVALSGYGRPQDKQRAQEVGFDAHLTKPVSLESVERVLTELGR